MNVGIASTPSSGPDRPARARSRTASAAASSRRRRRSSSGGPSSPSRRGRPRAPRRACTPTAGGSGRSPAIAAVRARSSTASSVGSQTRTRRRWYMRSKCGSPDQCGGPMRSSGVATRWRMRGMSHEPRSMRATSVCQSGARSKNSTVTIVDRSSGSFSMFHMSASESLMCASKRSTSCGPGMAAPCGADPRCYEIGSPTRIRRVRDVVAARWQNDGLMRDPRPVVGAAVTPEGGRPPGVAGGPVVIFRPRLRSSSPAAPPARRRGDRRRGSLGGVAVVVVGLLVTLSWLPRVEVGDDVVRARGSSARP